MGIEGPDTLRILRDMLATQWQHHRGTMRYHTGDDFFSDYPIPAQVLGNGSMAGMAYDDDGVIVRPSAGKSLFLDQVKIHIFAPSGTGTTRFKDIDNNFSNIEILHAEYGDLCDLALRSMINLARISDVSHDSGTVWKVAGATNFYLYDFEFHSHPPSRINGDVTTMDRYTHPLTRLNEVQMPWFQVRTSTGKGLDETNSGGINSLFVSFHMWEVNNTDLER